jgi:hypothetical protein
MKQKKRIVEKIPKLSTKKKMSFSSTANSQYFFAKISGISLGK